MRRVFKVLPKPGRSECPARAQSSQQVEVDRSGDGAAACNVGMKVIAAVVGRQKMRWLTRIAQRQVGIDDAVECSARANPSIERLTRRFVRRGVEIIRGLRRKPRVKKERMMFLRVRGQALVASRLVNRA